MSHASRIPKQAWEGTSPARIDVTSKSPVGDVSVVTLISLRYDMLSRVTTDYDPAKLLGAERCGNDDAVCWDAQRPAENYQLGELNPRDDQRR